MTRTRFFALGALVLLLLAAAAARPARGQSCGGGLAHFYVFDESGRTIIPNAAFEFRIVSENQLWKMPDFPKDDWIERVFPARDEPRLAPTRVYEIPENVYERLLGERRAILAESPDSQIFEVETARLSKNYRTEEAAAFATKIREGCGFLVVAEVSAEGFETGRFADDFACGCPKSYELRLRRAK